MNENTFNAEDDYKELNDAIKSKNGESEIIKIICNRTNEQRQEMKKLYISLYGEELEKVLNKN